MKTPEQRFEEWFAKELNKDYIVEECLWGQLNKIEKLPTKTGYRVTIDIPYPDGQVSEQELKHALRSRGVITKYKK